MKRRVVALAVSAVALAFGISANAQSTQTLRGDIAAVDKATLHLKSSSGQQTTIQLPEDLRVSLRVPAKLDDIKSGTFVGTAATPGPNGTLVASEVHIFPEALRGSRGSLTPGAHVIVYAQRDTSGDLVAQRISVGANGSVPPI